MFELHIHRTHISKLKDSAGEHTTIGQARLLDDNGAELFKWYSGENGSISSDQSGQDHRIIAREYILGWNFTRTSVAKVGFRNVKFEDWENLIDKSHHERYKQWNFKNVGLQILSETHKAFNSR